MSHTLYDLSSLPSTLSLISPALRRRQQTGDSASLLEAEETQEKLTKCDKTEQNISSPPEKNILSTKNNSAKDKNFLRRLARVSDEVSYSERIFLQHRRGREHWLGCPQSQMQVNKETINYGEGRRSQSDKIFRKYPNFGIDDVLPNVFLKGLRNYVVL